MSGMTLTCIQCGKDFERESKRGRPAVRCKMCRGVTVTPTPASAPKAVEAPAGKEPKWAIYECPTCKYETTQLSCAIELMCVSKHIKAVKMVKIGYKD